MFDLDIPVSLSFSGSKTSVHRKARRYCEWRGWRTTPVTSLCQGLCPTKHVTLQGGRMSPSLGTRFHLPSRDSCGGRASTTPDPLTSQGFCRVPEGLAEPRPASKPAYTDCRRYFSMQGPGSTHSPYFSMEPLLGCLVQPPPQCPLRARHGHSGTHTALPAQLCHRPGGKQVARRHRPGTSCGQ